MIPMYFSSSFTDEEGRVTHYANDATTGLPTSVTRGYGTGSAAISTYTWNTSWRVPSEIVDPGLTTDYSWATNGD